MSRWCNAPYRLTLRPTAESSSHLAVLQIAGVQRSQLRIIDLLYGAGDRVMVREGHRIFYDTTTEKPLRCINVAGTLASAVAAKVPVYFIRTNWDKSLGENIPDVNWKIAVEATGGRFYAASDEETILRAIREIDQISTGRIEMRQYSTEIPRFSPFGLFAVALWTCALLTKVSAPFFNKFP